MIIMRRCHRRSKNQEKYEDAARTGYFRFFMILSGCALCIVHATREYLLFLWLMYNNAAVLRVHVVQYYSTVRRKCLSPWGRSVLLFWLIRWDSFYGQENLNEIISKYMNNTVFVQFCRWIIFTRDIVHKIICHLRFEMATLSLHTISFSFFDLFSSKCFAFICCTRKPSRSNLI